MQKLLIATHNPGKFHEIVSGLEDLAIEFLSLSNLGIKDEVMETGKTHEENAFLKAQYFHKLTGFDTLGEDSGIYVEAFPGELGVTTRRFRNLHEASDEDWIQAFLREMEKISEEKRSAKFVCHACVIWQGEPHYFSGETRGIITKTLEAPLKPGIPLSSCFRPEGFSKVYAALSAEEKNRVSHRGLAVARVREFLRDTER